MLERPKLEYVYGSWHFKRLHCLYLNLRQIDNPSEHDRYRLELTTSILANKPFEERLGFYKNILRAIQDCAASDNFECAINLRNEAEEFKAHLLD